MNLRIRALIFLGIALFAFPELMKAPVVFKPNDKARYVAPGEEQLSGDAKELFEDGQQAEKQGNLKRAIGDYKALVRHHPKDALAPGALYHAAELQEKLHLYFPAAESYRMLVEKYPTNQHFNEAIEAQFRIGELYLGGKKIKVLGMPLASALDRAVEVFAAVVRTAPYGKYTARAQFDIGLAREKQGANDAALQAYQAVVDKFPNEPVAADAQYQIGYIWFTSARSGTKDVAATTNAETAFQDFLFRHPNSEKAAQARANLQLLEGRQTTSSFKVAQFYDKAKDYRAAVIYYNEVIRQQPGSRESEQAKRRIDQLRSKFGEGALQPAFVAAEAEAAKKKDEKEKPAPSEAGKPATAENQPPQSSSAPTSTPTPSTASATEQLTPAAPPPPPPAASPFVHTSTPPPAVDLALPPSSLGSEHRRSEEPSATPETSPEQSATSEASASPTP